MRRRMAAALYLSSAGPFAPSPRSRVISALLSLAVVALFLWLMIEMGLIPLGTSGKRDRLVSFSMSGSHQKQQQAKAHAAASHTAPPVPHAQSAEPKPIPPRPLWLTHNDYAASDISRLPKQAAADSDSQSSQSTYGPGEGPGGEQLFNAEWYRHPSDAELSGYMPERVPPGSWAIIACRMVENYHVEDCQELDESPPGSGLARGLRRAAWQFLVRPPRVNGQAKIGTWVKIRFDFTRNGEE